MQGLDLIGVVTQDDLVYEYDSEGKPTALLPDEACQRKPLKNLGKLGI